MTLLENILNPTIYWFGLTIEEPVTTATDFLTALVCFYSFFKLKSLKGKGNVYQLLRSYFFIMAIAMISAALAGHAFKSYLANDYRAIGWGLSALAIFFLEIASAEIARNELGNKTTRTLQIMMALHLLVFSILLFLPETRNFNLVKVNSGIGLIGFVLPIHFYHWFKTRHKGSVWFVAASLWDILPAIIFNLEISVSNWFNFHDISHVLMAGYTLILFRGSRQFKNANENL